MDVCVFCSSSNAVRNVYFEAAVELGNLIAQNAHTLIYGGANVGLMNALANEVKNMSGKVLGVIPQKIHDRMLSTNIADELIVTPSMDERKRHMRERSDAFIALPGGFGTLEEILEVITLKQLDYHQKPIVFINTDGFFNNLLAQLEHSYSELFARDNYRKLYEVVSSPKEAMDYIENYCHQELGAKWFNVPDRH